MADVGLGHVHRLGGPIRGVYRQPEELPDGLDALCEVGGVAVTAAQAERLVVATRRGDTDGQIASIAASPELSEDAHSEVILGDVRHQEMGFTSEQDAFVRGSL